MIRIPVLSRRLDHLPGADSVLILSASAHPGDSGILAQLTYVRATRGCANA